MAKDNWFTRALADVRRELVETGWYGRPDARDKGGSDRVLHYKLYPDRGSEREFLGWLQGEQERDSRTAPTEPSHRHEPDRGIDR